MTVSSSRLHSCQAGSRPIRTHSLAQRASVGSTEAAKDVVARVGVVGRVPTGNRPFARIQDGPSGDTRHPTLFLDLPIWLSLMSPDCAGWRPDATRHHDRWTGCSSRSPNDGRPAPSVPIPGDAGRVREGPAGQSDTQTGPRGRRPWRARPGAPPLRPGPAGLRGRHRHPGQHPPVRDRGGRPRPRPPGAYRDRLVLCHSLIFG